MCVCVSRESETEARGIMNSSESRDQGPESNHAQCGLSVLVGLMLQHATEYGTSLFLGIELLAVGDQEAFFGLRSH